MPFTSFSAGFVYDHIDLNFKETIIIFLICIKTHEDGLAEEIEVSKIPDNEAFPPGQRSHFKSKVFSLKTDNCLLQAIRT